MKRQCWVSDSFIDSFLQFLCQNVSHVEDTRFIKLDSLSSRYIFNSSLIKQLSSWLTGNELYEAGIIILALHSCSHWYLCLADIAKGYVYIVLPFNAQKRSNVDKNIISHILNSIQVLSENYDEKLEITQKWTSHSFYREANALNFPQQPANN